MGNVPVITATDLSDGLPTNQPRAEVFTFIEDELLAIVDQLPEAVDISTYGTPTQWAGYSLLTKMYLNAEVYTGTARWDDAENAANQVINSGKFSLDQDYMAIFAPDNGPQSMESIFSIVDDANIATNLNFWKRFLHPKINQVTSFDNALVGTVQTSTFTSLPGGAWGGHCTFPDFYAKYNDPNDVRNQQWLEGMLYTTNETGESVPLTDGDPPTPIVITPTLSWGKADAANPFNLGGGATEIMEGVRSLKYYPDPNAVGGQGLANNDYVYFRYADVLLMKAEATARRANDASLALPLVNEVRTARNAAPLATMTFEDLLDERGREFAFEHWRRNDMIRFGTWENAFGLKTNSDPTRRLFPIPQQQINTNPNLKQNPGYSGT